MMFGGLLKSSGKYAYRVLKDEISFTNHSYTVTGCPYKLFFKGALCGSKGLQYFNLKTSNINNILCLTIL